MSSDLQNASRSPVEDAELERLMDKLQHVAVLGCRYPTTMAPEIAAARARLSAYVSEKAEDTRRLDWLDNLNNFYMVTAAIDSAMRERPQ